MAIWGGVIETGQKQSFWHRRIPKLELGNEKKLELWNEKEEIMVAKMAKTFCW